MCKVKRKGEERCVYKKIVYLTYQCLNAWVLYWKVKIMVRLICAKTVMVLKIFCDDTVKISLLSDACNSKNFVYNFYVEILEITAMATTIRTWLKKIKWRCPLKLDAGSSEIKNQASLIRYAIKYLISFLECLEDFLWKVG